MQIRKILECLTPWQVELDENYQDKYGYDLLYYIHEKTQNETGYIKKFKGYIELEVAQDWQEYNIPSYWSEITFLARKCYKYNTDEGQFTNIPKDNADRTVYLKFNKNLDNCFVSSVNKIIKLGSTSDRSDGTYKNTYIKMDKGDLTFGIYNSMKYINEFMGKK